jgi:predicted RecB family nuclease
MRRDTNGITLSATDLSHQMSCSHLITQDLRVALGLQEKPVKYEDPVLQLTIERGLEHEAKVLTLYKEKGLRTIDLTDSRSIAATEAAMGDGYDVIFQAYLCHDGFRGFADFLLKTDRRSSKFGPYSYEVLDTKLTQHTRAGTMLQLSLYSDMIARIQETVPEYMHILTPVDGLERRQYRVEDYQAYYRVIKSKLQKIAHTAVAEGRPTLDTYPDPKPHCSICTWRKHCEKQRRDDDHLSIVAGMTTSHIQAFERQDITTVEKLATTPPDALQQPATGSIETLRRHQRQARAQYESRQQRRLIQYERELEEGSGYYLLPAPNTGDIYFDIEGAKQFADRNLDYLFGWVTRDDGERLSYHAVWAHNEKEERQALEQFMAMLAERKRQYPEFFIYHYSHYEPVALKRLMMKYGTCENQIDALLREQRFVDLAAVVRQSLYLSVESYSIKKLEPFYHFKRKAELSRVVEHRIALELAVELRRSKSMAPETLELVQLYNEDDCYSTYELHMWLEQQRPKELPRRVLQDGSLPEKTAVARDETTELVERLQTSLPDDVSNYDFHDDATLLLSQIINFYGRELKAAYWERFRLQALSDVELLSERSGLAQLSHIERIPPAGRSRSHVDVYSYPPQECEIKERQAVYSFNGDKFERVGSVDWLDGKGHRIAIKKSKQHSDFHPFSLFAWDAPPKTEHQEMALLTLGAFVAEHGIDSSRSEFECERQLLLLGCAERHEARLPYATTPLPKGEIDVAAAVLEIIEADQRKIIPIQGPPGAGKTYTASSTIAALVRKGLKVGVTAISHKVILNVLSATYKRLREDASQFQFVHKGDPKEHQTEGITIVNECDALTTRVQAKQPGVFGATSFYWSRAEIFKELDILFVDEAAQFSLAGTLATAQCAKKVVLLGDPQQLQQPIQVEHPGHSGNSALGHIIAGRGTLATHLGFFLERTWRLCPDINALTSELFYESRLRTQENTIHQKITGDGLFSGSGYFLVEVEHKGNRNRSLEEVQIITQIVQYLMDPLNGFAAINANREAEPLCPKDILIVAPFNMQVDAISEALPDYPVGTVDKFQGQEGAVVIYSLTCSSPEEAPRGMGFLYALDRLNVATSRAKCVCIVVGDPSLFEPNCKTPEQMRLANAFCRLRELATVVTVEQLQMAAQEQGHPTK